MMLISWKRRRLMNGRAKSVKNPFPKTTYRRKFTIELHHF